MVINYFSHIVLKLLPGQKSEPITISSGLVTRNAHVAFKAPRFAVIRRCTHRAFSMEGSRDFRVAGYAEDSIARGVGNLKSHADGAVGPLGCGDIDLVDGNLLVMPGIEIGEDL